MIPGFDRNDLFSALSPRRRDPFAAADGRRTGAAAPADTDPRQVRDTVTLSEGGHKIVNLNRARELGAELRAEKDPAAFRDKLRQAMADVRRIGRLFSEVVASLFRRGRPPLA